MDKKHHYVVATCILVNNNTFLIAKRAKWEKAFPDMWTVPGGRLETSDYMTRPKDTSDQWYNVIEDLAKREVKEEVGITINQMEYLTSLAFIRPDGIPTIVVSMYTHCNEQNVILSHELTDFAWVTLAEAKTYNLIPGIYEELDMLDKKLKGEHINEIKF